MAITFVFKQIVIHILGLILALLCCLQLLWKFVRSPIGFVKRTFFAKHDVMPECLNRPDLGTHNFIHLEDVKLHYIANGDESKPLMLFLHGFPEFWYSWRHQIREFSKDYRVVAVDQRGYADSDKPNGYKNYTTDILIKDIKQLILALGYESCVLVGHDWGGSVAWGVASQYPDVVNKLIVMNCPHRLAFEKYLNENRTQKMKSWYMLFFQIPVIPELILRSDDFEMFSFIAKMKHGTEEDVEGYKYAFGQPGAVTAAVNWYRAAWKMPSKNTHGEITMPTLVIWGNPDVAFTKELAVMSGDYVNDFTLKYVEDSSHFVQSESPEEVNRIMREYLNEKK